MEDNEILFHNDAVSCFNNKLFDGIFSKENLVSKHKAIVISDTKFKGYFLEKGKKSYFAPSEFIDKLPFKIKDSIEVDYKNDVFEMVKSIIPITIPAEKRLSFRELVDIMPAFKHTNPKHFLLYKILTITAYCDRINYRVSTESGFGKDSVVSIISQLVNSTANIYSATFAKLEYSLMNKFILFNELGNLKTDDKINMQGFLLAVGAYFNSYLKRTRKTETTVEQYDVSKLSLGILYNLPEYYVNKAQEYFDQMFTKAVINRFIPFVFEGRLTTQFQGVLDVNKIVENNKKVYENVIATINYFRLNNLTSIKYDVNKSIVFSKDLMRYERTFLTILKYIGEYSSSEEEFRELSLELYNCYKKYGELVSYE